ncbi:MAG: transposase [Gemmataceae bacterium]
MPAIAYHITWTTYGSWLPGDERGWVQSGLPGIQAADAMLAEATRQRLAEAVVVLSPAQREIVEATIRDVCTTRGWTLHAVNPRSNHVHVVVTAEATPETVMSQLKAWCSRQLSDHAGLVGSTRNGRRRWWTEHGSTKYIFDEGYLHNAIRYVNERQ